MTAGEGSRGGAAARGSAAERGAAERGAAERGAAQRGAPERGPVQAGGGCLFIVATPIGNLGDVTFRAIDVLRTVPIVAAEDTRITKRLFARYEIATPLVSYHAKSSPGRERELLEHLRRGLDLALVTDAGTPTVSDPGGELAAGWAAEGGIVVAVPGASAVLAALAAAALPAPRWCFEGFLPRSGAERRERLSRIAADERATVIFEAAPRIGATLRDLADGCGSARPAAICRELTKLHEEIVRGSLGELAELATARKLTLRGEFAIVVAARTADAPAEAADDKADRIGAARGEVERLEREGVSHSEAVRRVAAASKVSRRALY